MKTHLIAEESGRNEVQDINAVLHNTQPPAPGTIQVKPKHIISKEISSRKKKNTCHLHLLR
jgi:hypothetical protein